MTEWDRWSTMKCERDQNLTILKKWYIHKPESVLKNVCCILIKCDYSSIIIIVQIQVVRTSLFLSTFSPWWHEERDTNHKSLCYPYYAVPTPNARRILCCLRSLSVETQTDGILSDPTQPRVSTVDLNSGLFKILQIFRNLFRIWRHQPNLISSDAIQPNFLSGGLYYWW